MRPGKARGEKFGKSNERRATPHGLISGATLRDGSFLAAAALFLADVHSAHYAQNALQRPKNDRVAALGFYMNRP